MAKRFAASAGDRRTRVTVYRATRTANSMNEPEITYTGIYCKRWASLAPTSGREFIAAQQVDSELAAIMRVPSDTETRAITTDMRIAAGSRTFNIRSAYDEMDQRKSVVLLCTEVL